MPRSMAARQAKSQSPALHCEREFGHADSKSPNPDKAKKMATIVPPTPLRPVSVRPSLRSILRTPRITVVCMATWLNAQVPTSQVVSAVLPDQ